MSENNQAQQSNDQAAEPKDITTRALDALNRAISEVPGSVSADHHPAYYEACSRIIAAGLTVQHPTPRWNLGWDVGNGHDREVMSAAVRGSNFQVNAPEPEVRQLDNSQQLTRLIAPGATVYFTQDGDPEHLMQARVVRAKAGKVFLKPLHEDGSQFEVPQEYVIAVPLQAVMEVFAPSAPVTTPVTTPGVDLVRMASQPSNYTWHPLGSVEHGAEVLVCLAEDPLGYATPVTVIGARTHENEIVVRTTDGRVFWLPDDAPCIYRNTDPHDPTVPVNDGNAGRTNGVLALSE